MEETINTEEPFDTEEPDIAADPHIKKSFVLMIDGRYRQWDVIAKVGDGFVVLSHEVMYHVGYGETNRWRDCFLRSYLHDVWLKPIQEGLSLKNVSPDEMLLYQTDNTRDRLFILSKEEHTQWKQTIPKKATPYWLRTPYGHLHVPYIWIATPEGHHLGESVHNSNIGIVPAIYLSERAIEMLC